MKRILCIVFMILCITGCSVNRENKNGVSVGPEGNTVEISYSSGTYFDKNWDDKTGTYENSVIPDKETALAVASAIFESMEKSEVADTFVPQAIFFDEGDEIWIVSFWKDQENSGENGTAVFTGYSCSIAIRQEDGKVLRIWYGE